jgi:hypothetical protein
MNPLLRRPALVTGDVARATFPCYPFTRDDLSCLLWARDTYRQAHDAIVEAEGRATDEPARRPKADAYIADCLASIRRRMARLAEESRAAAAEDEGATDTMYGFATIDRLVELYGPGVLQPTPDVGGRAAEPVAVKPAKKVKQAACAGEGLWG